MAWETVPRGATISNSNHPLWEGKAFRRHRHQEMEIAVILEGDGYFECGYHLLPVSPGTVCWIAPETEHSFRRTSSLLTLATMHSGPIPSYLSAMFDPELSRQGFQVHRLSPKALNDFDALYGNCRAVLPDPWTVAVHGQLWLSWLNVLLAFLRMNENFSAETVSSVAQVAELIRSQPGRDLSVTEMANLTGFSETHFRTLFKQLYHRSPKEFQTQCRLELALQQLCQSHKSVSDVADYLGFETISSFSTWFRKLVHMSPSEWRDGQRRTAHSREY